MGGKIMKRTVIAFVVAAAALVSCQKETVEPQVPLTTMTITVTSEQTKAELVDGAVGGKDVRFQAGDALSVFANQTNYRFETSEGGTSALFTGAAPVIEDYYYVASPYKNTHYIDASNNMHVAIPEVQIATLGGVDPKALISAARLHRGEGASLKHAVTLLKVTVPEGERYRKIEVACAAGGAAGDKPVLNQTIAGDIVMDYNGNFSLGDTRYTSIKLVPAVGNTVIESGEYYIAMRPGTFRLVIAYVSEDNHFYVRRSSQGNTFTSGHIKNVGELSAEFYADETAPALLTTGSNVNIYLKQLVDAGVSAITTDDNTITAINVETMTLGGCLPSAKTLSTYASDWPVYAQLEGTVVTIRTPGNALALNSDSAGIFRNFKSLTNIDFSNFIEGNVTSLFRAFSQSGFTSLDLRWLRGDNVTTMEYMCEGSTALTEVLLDNFSANALTNFSYAFTGCTSLETLNLESANTSGVTDFRAFLNNCTSLAECRLGYDFSIAGVTSDANLNNMWYNAHVAAPGKCELYIYDAAYNGIVNKSAYTKFTPANYNIRGITPATGPKVSIFGDSISTFKDYINGYTTYYPYGSLDDVEMTYWMKLIALLDGTLETNISYSGSCVCWAEDSYQTILSQGIGKCYPLASRKTRCFLSRYDDKGIGSPDLLILYGGTNDKSKSKGNVRRPGDGDTGYYYRAEDGAQSLYAPASGEVQALCATASADLDTDYFAPAYVELLRRIFRDHSTVKVVCLVGDGMSEAQCEWVQGICDYFATHGYSGRIKTVSFHNDGNVDGKHYDNVNIPKVSGVHPDADGMTYMANKIYNEIKDWI